MRELGGLGGDGFQMAYVPRRAAASATAAMSAAAAEGANSPEAVSAGRKASVQDALGAYARKEATEGVVAENEAGVTVAVGAKRKQAAAAAERRPAKKPASVSNLAQMAGKAAAKQRKNPAARQTSSSQKPAAAPVETSAAAPTAPGPTSAAAANLTLPPASVAAPPAASAEGHSPEVPLPSPVGRRTRHSQASLQPLPSPVGRHTRHVHSALQPAPHPARHTAPAVAAAGNVATASVADAAAGTLHAAAPVAAKRNQRSATAKLLDALTPADALGGAHAPARGRQTRGAVAAAHDSSGATQQPASGAEALSAPQPSSPFRRQLHTATELAAAPQAAEELGTAAPLSSKQSTRRGGAAAAAADAAGSTAAKQESAAAMGASPVDGVHAARRRAATVLRHDELPSQPQLGPADGVRRCSKRREGSRAAASLPDEAQAPHAADPVKSDGPAVVAPARAPQRLHAQSPRLRSSHVTAASLAHETPPPHQEQLGRGARQHRPKQMYSPSKPASQEAAGAADNLVSSAVQRSLRRPPGPGSTSAGRTAVAGNAAAVISGTVAEPPQAAPPARTRGQAEVLRGGTAAAPAAGGPAAAGHAASDAAAQHTAPLPAGAEVQSAALPSSPLVASVAEALRVAPGAQVPPLPCMRDRVCLVRIGVRQVLQCALGACMSVQSGLAGQLLQA